MPPIGTEYMFRGCIHIQTFCYICVITREWSPKPSGILNKNTNFANDVHITNTNMNMTLGQTPKHLENSPLPENDPVNQTADVRLINIVWIYIPCRTVAYLNMLPSLF